MKNLQQAMIHNVFKSFIVNSNLACKQVQLQLLWVN